MPEGIEPAAYRVVRTFVAFRAFVAGLTITYKRGDAEPK